MKRERCHSLFSYLFSSSTSEANAHCNIMTCTHRPRLHITENKRRREGQQVPFRLLWTRGRVLQTNSQVCSEFHTDTRAPMVYSLSLCLSLLPDSDGHICQQQLWAGCTSSRPLQLVHTCPRWQTFDQSPATDHMLKLCLFML